VFGQHLYCVDGSSMQVSYIFAAATGVRSQATTAAAALFESRLATFFKHLLRCPSDARRIECLVDALKLRLTN